MPSTVKVRIRGARNLRQTASPLISASSSLQHHDRLAQVVGSSFVTITLGVGGHTTLVSNDEDLETFDFHSSDMENGPGNTGILSASSTTGNSKKRSYSARTKMKRAPHVWNEEFRFEVADDKLLQEEPLIFKVWVANSPHLDGSASKNTSSLGLVYIDLNPLLLRTSANEHQRERGLEAIDGWFPLYDTLTGVRGELGLSVKINFIGDVNPFRDSSAGVQLFPFPLLDKYSGYSVLHVYGFVEELVVADDPEFEVQGSNSILQYRQASRTVKNETRQSLMYLLDSSVRRRMCKKVLVR